MVLIKDLTIENKKENLSEIEIAVLKVMHSRSVYGSHHKREDTIINSGFPSDKIGEAKKAIKSLKKKGYILIAKKSEKAITLNKKLYNKIEEIVRR